MCIRDSWHIHHAKNGGGQILVCVAGHGYYQEWGKPAQELRPGDVVNIPVGVKHWHGAAPDSWFSHLEMCIRDSPRIIELNAEYAMLLERKKSSYLLSIISELSTIAKKI